MKLRTFNKKGIDSFRAYLAECKQKPTTPPPFHLLEDENLTDAVYPDIELERKILPTKRDVADYLVKALEPVPYKTKQSDKGPNIGLWAWLSLLYFNSVCPADDNGSRVVYNDYRYIPLLESRYFYRHLLFLVWRAVDMAPKFNRILLYSPTDKLDKINDTIQKSLYLTRIPCIFEVIDRIYWDEQTGKPREGMISTQTKPGGLEYRFPVRIHQLEKTYDLMSVDADQLINLLGDEFDFKEKTDDKKIEKKKWTQFVPKIFTNKNK